MTGSAIVCADPADSFQPTAEEQERLALMSQSEQWFLDHLQGAREFIGGQVLDPKLQYYLEARRRRTLEEVRRSLQMYDDADGRVIARNRMAREWALFTKVTAPMRKVEDRCIPGPRGPIPIRTYTPHTRHSDPLPVLVYFHGGGWIYGSIEAVDRAVRLMANEAQAIVINVEYRLAPEHPWPAAHDDAEAAFLWARENAESLGGHPAMVGVGGDSAGGNLCVSVANRQIQAGRPPPLYQLLYYNAPSFSPDCESARLFSNGYVFDTVFRDFMLSRVYPGEGTAERAAQELRAVSLTQMPATIMVTAGFDMLRDGGRSFARKLEEHGVPVTYLHYPSLIHGLLQWSGVVTDAEHAAELSARVLGVAIRSRLAMLR